MPLSEQQQVNAANDAPEWAISEKAIHEILFCKAFLKRHPMKCINGRFYDIDGLVQDDTIRSEISGMLTPYYATQISRKVQHDRIHTRSAIVMTIQISDNLIDSSEIQGFINLSQQMILRYKTVDTKHFHLISFRSVFAQHSTQLP